MQQSGILLVQKPAGLSSAQVTNQLKRAHKFARIGHGGTLDPFATGLLVVLLGEATKIARFLLDGDKEYLATAALGTETDTGDLTGQAVQEAPVPAISQAQWEQAAKKFQGWIDQTPPPYSAIKFQGKPLYEYARKGEIVHVPARKIFLHELTILRAEAETMQFRVRCSGGTYVRVLAADLAREAGTLAHLTALQRTASSAFRVENAQDLEKLCRMPAEELPLLPILQALEHLPTVECNEEQARKLRQGNLAVFQELKPRIEKPGYFLLTMLAEGKTVPVAVANHHPMMEPFCSLERVFDPALAGT